MPSSFSAVKRRSRRTDRFQDTIDDAVIDHADDDDVVGSNAAPPSTTAFVVGVQFGSKD